MIRFQAKIRKDGKRFSISFPDLPGCFSEAATLDEAKIHAQESLSLYLEEARDPLWEIPEATIRTGTNYVWIRPHEEVAIPLMIRQARLKRGYSQKELAARLGISFQQLQKLEMPRKSNPTVKTLAAISRALDEELEIRLSA